MSPENSWAPIAGGGFTYTWIPKHLSDTSHRASPRSFVVAIGKAAESAAPNTATPIDYRGIHEGVRAASRTRVDELREDHPLESLRC